MDEIEILGQARQDPASLLSERPVTLDEVQRSPELLLAVKREVDRVRQAGDVLLTGSANLLLARNVAESLAGRAVYIPLPPFCPVEWLERAGGLEPIDRLFADDFQWQDWPAEAGDWPAWLERGGFPPALQMEETAGRQLWFSGYVATYLERDLRQLSEVANLPDFQRLMALTANQCARLINQANLARDAGLSHATCHRYLKLLETGCLLTRVPPYLANATSMLVKSPKWFWTDCGLAAWLAGIRTPSALANRLDPGFWLEQTLFQTVQAWHSLDPGARRIYFWRDRAGREVDFILEKDGVLVALEIKSGRRVGLEDTRGLAAFRDSLRQPHPRLRGVVLHAGEPRSLGEHLFVLPWGWMVPKGG